eukprot:GILI01013163.1.p1 GENE.GILI01013163.1~~GILI01013163.1.p1  ORF type:complete len:195 (+),score=39.51 GILI01013163.1:46-630(+)
MDLAVSFSIGLFVLVFIASWPSKQPSLPFSQKLLAGWFIFNGVLIHIFLDGLVGACQNVPYLFELYSHLDKRYPLRDPSVMMISYTELFVMGPLCLFVYYGILHRKPWRHPLQLLVSAIQLVGTIIFTGGEIMSDFAHIPTDFELTFTLDKIVFFWVFFVAANLLWSILPLCLICSSFASIVSAINGSRQRKSE